MWKGLLSAVLDYEKQRELDDEYVSTFRLKAVNNGDSISYSEKEVHTSDDIPRVLNELDKIGYVFYILGQGTGRNSSVKPNDDAKVYRILDHSRIKNVQKFTLGYKLFSEFLDH